MYNDWGWKYLDEFIGNFEIDKFVKPKFKILFVSKLSRAKSKSKRKKIFSRNTTPHYTISLTLDDFFLSEISEKHTTKVLPLF